MVQGSFELKVRKVAGHVRKCLQQAARQPCLAALADFNLTITSSGRLAAIASHSPMQKPPIGVAVALSHTFVVSEILAFGLFPLGEELGTEVPFGEGAPGHDSASTPSSTGLSLPAQHV